MRGAGRILVVEDDPDVLNETARLLREAGYAVAMASNGEQALQRIRVEPPALMLLDRDLPDCDGNALCRQLKQDEATADILVVIASSTHVESDEQAQGFESGADGYITRPISNREFLARVRSFVSIHDLTRSLREQAAQLQERNEALLRQRLASLNVMEDAVDARERVETVNQALRESEERFRRVSALTSDIAYSCSATQGGRHAIMWMTGAADRITGYTTEEIQARGCWRFLVQEDDRALFDRHVIGLAPGTASSCEIRIQRKDGGIAWIESTAECTGDPQHPGRLLLYGGLKDITERKGVQEVLRKSHEMIVKLTAQVPGVVYQYRLEPDGRSAFPFSSPGMNVIYEVTPEEVREDATPVFSRLHPDDHDVIVDAIQESARTLGAFHVEFRVVLPRQGLRWRLCDAMPERTENGGTLWHGIITDITDRKNIEADILAAKDRAEMSEKLKDAFIANISHEIRTPLNIILGYIGVIAEKFLPLADAGDQRFFDSVERGGERLMRTVDMILNVSRLQAGEFVLRPAEVDLPGLVRRIVSDHQPLARKKGIVLSCVDECGSAVVTADEYCITQAVSNLLNNAIKFTMHGQVEARVFRNREGKPCISCRDTGIGIAKDYLPLLFSRYSQEQTGYSRPFEGLGLGMALVKEYLALNDATIQVESEKGVGSTFTITFHGTHAQAAGATVEETVARHAPYKAAVSSASAPRALPSVLLVEDDEMTVEFMNVILEDAWQVHSARSGEEAWAVLRAAPVDIILMDISLAGPQTGLELTQEIRQNPVYRLIPIIAVTAHAYASDRDNCLDAGCDDFIRKPIDRDVVLGTMDRLLAR